jgi:hypothetical protein
MIWCLKQDYIKPPHPKKKLDLRCCINTCVKNISDASAETLQGKNLDSYR